jgi:hypothetical protein
MRCVRQAYSSTLRVININWRLTGYWVPGDLLYPACCNIFLTIYSPNICRTADPSGRAVYGVRLRPSACWDRGFESHRGHVCLSLVSVCVLSGRGLCDRPIRHPEESYRPWCVSEYDQVKKQNLDTCCEQVEEIKGLRYEYLQNWNQKHYVVKHGNVLLMLAI